MYHSDLRCHALRLPCVHENEPARPSPSLHASVRLPRELRARFTVSAPDARPVADAARDPPSPSDDERLRQLSLDGRQGRFRVQREFGSGLRQLEAFHERIGSGKHVKAAKTAAMQVAVLPPSSRSASRLSLVRDIDGLPDAPERIQIRSRLLLRSDAQNEQHAAVAQVRRR
jgi:hypothetical protein